MSGCHVTGVQGVTARAGGGQAGAGGPRSDLGGKTGCFGGGGTAATTTHSGGERRRWRSGGGGGGGNNIVITTFSRKKQAAAQVATRIGTRKSPEGESSPLRGTSPGHFQRARPGNLASCKFATEVRESPGPHRHAQMAAVATRPPLQSRQSLLRGAYECPNSSWGAGATKVIPVPSLGFPRGGQEERSHDRACLSAAK